MHNLYLFYGATFVTAGVLLAFQARLPQGVLPRPAKWWLAAFAFLHGLSEWAQMESLGSGGRRGDLLALGLGFVSFAALGQFAVTVLVKLGQWPRWSVVVPTTLSIAWAAVVATMLTGGPNDTEQLELLRLLDIEAATRYGFALPASMLAAWALWLVRRGRGELDSIARHFGWASAAFVAYGIVAGAIGPPGRFVPASHLNSETIFWATGIRIEVFRMVCGVFMTGLLSEALVVQAARERNELERRREEFISIVAHDLRSPIGVIDMGAELLEHHIHESEKFDRQRTDRILQNIRTGARSLDRMVRDLLDTARIETSTLALVVREVDLRSLITSIVDRATQTTQGHLVNVTLPESLPIVRADPIRIEQILFNLLSNAAKYSAPETAISVELSVGDDEVEISVTNQGAGLSQQEIDRVFSRYYRGERHVRQAEGLGLGLYIVKGLVQAQGGRIWVDSEIDRYATFRFTLARSRAT